MTALKVFGARLRGLFARRQRETRLSEEIQSHLDLLTDEFVSRGMSPAAARIAARREFGGVEAIKDAARDERGWPFLESLLQDARFALRQLRRNPSFTFTALLTFAIGIGGTTAIFSILDVVVVRPLPYTNADRLVTIQETLHGLDGGASFGPFPVSAADTKFWREHSASFEQIANASGTLLNLTGSGEPERLVTGTITPGFLRILGATTELGRLLLDEEDQPGREHVLVLDHAFWRTRFNADPAIIGRTLTLNGESHEVVGVLSRGFAVPNIKLLHSLPTREMPAQMWKPLALRSDQFPAVGGYSYAALALLKPGITLAQAREELAATQSSLLRSVPGKGRLETVLVPLQDQMASRSRASLELLLLAVATVLVIGCVNIANLLLSRTVVRRREISVREALGAGRARLARQMLVENVLLSVLGGAGGVAIAFGTLRVVLAIAPADVPRLEAVTIDFRVLAFAAMVSIVCGLLIGLVPAWRANRLDLHRSLKGRGDGDAQPATARIRSLLVTSEIGLSAAAVAVAALLLQSFAGLLQVDRGFDASRILTVDINLAGTRYPDSKQQAAFTDAVMADIQATPGVSDAGFVTQLPLTGTGALSALSADGTSVPGPQRPVADVRSVSPSYFRAMGLPLKTGRLIEEADRERNVAVLSQRLADRGWPGENPLGKRFRFGLNPSAAVYVVIGTVGDVRGTSLDQPPTPTGYVPYPQRTGGGISLIVKTAGDPSSVMPAVQRALRAHDPELPIGAFRTMDDVVDDSLAARRFQLLLVSFFAILAALLASVGVYGVMAYSVAQRHGEIGIRLALGAKPAVVVLSVLREALKLAAAGILVAIPITLLGGSFLARFLFNVTPRDPAALAATIAVIAATAIAAAAGPALRASRVDPLAALRSE